MLLSHLDARTPPRQKASCQVHHQLSKAPELSGIGLTFVGSFNPSIFQPMWFANAGLLRPEEVAIENVRDLLISTQATVFATEWLGVQVTEDRCSFTTLQTARQDQLRDLAIGTFQLLEHTPVDAVGINADNHFLLGSESAWHDLGDRYAPKDEWPLALFPKPDWAFIPGRPNPFGLRSVVMEINRADTGSGYTRVELAPSVQVSPYGIFIGVNDHYQMTRQDDAARGTGDTASQVISTSWQASLRRATDIVNHILSQAEDG